MWLPFLFHAHNVLSCDLAIVVLRVWLSLSSAGRVLQLHACHQNTMALLMSQREGAAVEQLSLVKPLSLAFCLELMINSGPCRLDVYSLLVLIQNRHEIRGFVRYYHRQNIQLALRVCLR